MADQAFCTVRSVPMPLAIAGAGTSTLRVAIIAPMTLVWSDGTTETLPVGAVVQDSSGSPAAVNGAAFVWLVVLSRGTGVLWLVQESDYANLPTLLPAPWALYARLDGGQYARVAQL